MKKDNSTTTEVLVVDDSPETVELIKRNLESVGYQVYTANNVQSAIKLLGTVHIDLLITDLKMPGENGIELVRHVSENYKGIGILVITGFPTIKGAVESLFKVKVAEVRTSIFEGKLRRRGRFAGYRGDWKKAYVRLKAGQKMPEFAEL
jgi:DNA-binding NtrC family response regulator